MPLEIDLKQLQDALINSANTLRDANIILAQAENRVFSAVAAHESAINQFNAGVAAIKSDAKVE